MDTVRRLFKVALKLTLAGIPDPGFEKFRIIFHDRIRGGARLFWNFGSTNLNRYTLKTNFSLHFM